MYIYILSTTVRCDAYVKCSKNQAYVCTYIMRPVGIVEIEALDGILPVMFWIRNS